MVNDYKKFLSHQGSNSFWRKAKQIEYNKNATEKIQKDLTVNLKNLTTRNSMTLRYLGFIINKGSNKLELSNAGTTFVNSPYKQKILDEQLFKVYLDCHQVNNQSSIPVAPVKVMLMLLKELKTFTFDEYQLFICWVNSYQEILFVVDLIKSFRAGNQNEYIRVFEGKVSELKIGDFSDNISRLFDMLMTASYFKIDKSSHEISSIFESKDLDVIIGSFSDDNFSKEKYYNYLTTNDGWHTYSSNPEYREIINVLEKISPEEREDIVARIIQPKSLPPLDKIKPQSVSLEIKLVADINQTVAKARGKISSKRKGFKVDYGERDRVNKKYGDFGEEIVVVYEKNRLSPDNHSQLIDKIKRVSIDDDSLGYDVVSFDKDGVEKHIEVKAVQKQPNSFRFFISARELEVARTDKFYQLYIVFDYLSLSPAIFEMPNPFITSLPGVTIIPIKHMVEVVIDAQETD